MKNQCPRCKKIENNGKFVNINKIHLIPGLKYHLCPECRFYLRVSEIG